MKVRCAFLIAGLAVTGTLVAGTPAGARPIDKGHFRDVFTSDVYDCDGITAQDSGDARGTSSSTSAGRRRSRTTGRASTAPW